MAKPKVAFYWCASCGGCEEAVIDIDEELLKVADAVDIAFWPAAMGRGPPTGTGAGADGKPAMRAGIVLSRPVSLMDVPPRRLVLCGCRIVPYLHPAR